MQYAVGKQKKFIGCLQEELRDTAAGVQIFKNDQVDPVAMPEVDASVFSVSTEACRIQRHMRRFMKKLQGMEEKSAASFIPTA